MYNEKRKKEFLDTLTSKAEIGFIKRVFIASEPYENDEQIDLCEFDRESILNLFSYMEIAQLTTAQGCLYMLRRYQKWCIDNKYSNKISMVEISLNELQFCLTKLPEIITYEELQRNENLLLNICDQLILESIYLGIKGNNYCELISMSEKDIDVMNKTIKLCTDRTAKVNDRFITLCRTSASIYDYYLIDGRKQILVGELPIKLNAQSNTKDKASIIGSRLHRFKKIDGFKPNLGAAMLFDSGFVNACKEAMKEMEIDNFRLFMNTDAGRLIYSRYNMPIRNKSNKINKYKGYFE